MGAVVAMSARNLAVHPAAEIFPLIVEGGDDWNELANSMRDRGFDARSPVLLFEGKIIDGRNRLAVARSLNIEPAFADVSADEIGESPTLWVKQRHARRNLTPSQRAAVAVEIETGLAREAAERKREAAKRGAITRKNKDGDTVSPSSAAPAKRDNSGRAATQAAKSVGAGIKSTERLKAVRESAPEVFDAVKTGKVVNVSHAVALANASEDERAEAMERIASGEKAADVVRELPKMERKPATSKWDADGVAARLNSQLSDLHHECPGADADVFIPVLEKWARKFREKKS